MRALQKLPDPALQVLAMLVVEAEDRADNGREAFWQWLRAATWCEWTRRRYPAKANPEPGFPTLSAEDLENAAGALAAFASHEETSPTDEASPALAEFFAELGTALAVIRRHVAPSTATMH